MPDAAKDLEFLVAMVKTGTLTVNYDDAGALLGWNKRQCIKKMCQFRKDYDWPVDKSAPKAAAPKAAGKSPAAKAPKRAAEDGEVKKPAAKRAKASKKAAKEEEEEAVKDVEVPAAEQAQVFEEGAEDEY